MMGKLWRHIVAVRTNSEGHAMAKNRMPQSESIARSSVRPIKISERTYRNLQLALAKVGGMVRIKGKLKAVTMIMLLDRCVDLAIPEAVTELKALQDKEPLEFEADPAFPTSFEPDTGKSRAK